ncbi:MAG TPA: SURF1 family protein, partial [Anaerolineales bacterium]|nr:SURF1 family protein [Anaerolineales bacterium]
MILAKLFNRQWWKTTLLVILAASVMVRLGIWQLDRLAQRREFNARVEAQLDQPPLDLNTADAGADLGSMEYREVIVTGEYDPAGEVALRNQAWDNHIGVHLLTPLKIAGSDEAVLVNRGWVPLEDYSSGDLTQYAEPGMVEVRGVIRASQSKPEIGGRADQVPSPGAGKLMAWNLVNVPGIAAQEAYPLLPAYIQQEPDPQWTSLPYRSQPDLELTEGPHFGYALQWFSFAAILVIGYPFYIRREERASISKSRGRGEY